MCYKAHYCHFQVVVKQLKNGASAELSLIHEANMMIACSTKYTPYLFGINLTESSLIMSSHGSNGTLAAILEGDISDGDKSASRWIQLVLNIAEGVHAIHSKQVTHNDLKPDNVLLDIKDGIHFPIIADFGKACFLRDGQKYNIPAGKHERYMKQHSHIAPDLIKGMTPQSVSTDVYSLGYIAACIKKSMDVQQLAQIECIATQPMGRDRPAMDSVI